MHITLDSARMDRDSFGRLRHLLITHPGECRAILHLAVQNMGEAILDLNKLPVNPSQSFFEDMHQYFGPDCAQPVYKNGH